MKSHSARQGPTMASLCQHCAAPAHMNTENITVHPRIPSLLLRLLHSHGLKESEQRPTTPPTLPFALLSCANFNFRALLPPSPCQPLYVSLYNHLHLSSSSPNQGPQGMLQAFSSIPCNAPHYVDRPPELCSKRIVTAKTQMKKLNSSEVLSISFGVNLKSSTKSLVFYNMHIIKCNHCCIACLVIFCYILGQNTVLAN